MLSGECFYAMSEFEFSLSVLSLKQMRTRQNLGDLPEGSNENNPLTPPPLSMTDVLMQIEQNRQAQTTLVVSLVRNIYDKKKKRKKNKKRKGELSRPVPFSPLRPRGPTSRSDPTSVPYLFGRVMGAPGASILLPRRLPRIFPLISHLPSPLSLSPGPHTRAHTPRLRRARATPPRVYPLPTLSSPQLPDPDSSRGEPPSRHYIASQGACGEGG